MRVREEAGKAKESTECNDSGDAMRCWENHRKVIKEPGYARRGDLRDFRQKHRAGLTSRRSRPVVSKKTKRLPALAVSGKPEASPVSLIARRRLLNVSACDEGSGTVNGIMLIAVAAILISAIALAGNLLVCISQARSAADQAAIAGAASARDGDFDPCIKSRLASSLNKATLVTCHVDEEDVTVKVAVETEVPFVPLVSRMARAGPIECS